LSECKSTEPHKRRPRPDRAAAPRKKKKKKKKIKKSEMGGAYSMLAKGEKCIQNFSLKSE
jgi:hypothetical protein